MEHKSSWKQPQQQVGQHLTGLKVKNTLKQENQLCDFVPLKGKTVRWYMCGPTVYDLSHMGHARTYICFDSLRKIMRDYFGYNVIMQVNITDIDDKIIKRANEQQVNFEDFSRNNEREFWKDMKALNVETPDILTRVSEFVPEIVEFIKQIIDNGYGYESNGSVYFDVPKFQQSGQFHYGCLEPSAINNAVLLAEGEGVLQSENKANEKRSEKDFALWKKSKENEPYWESEWGKGRPGWHIECSAMAANHFDHPLDIHSGGVDLKFPHHTNEIAQSEAFYQKSQWVNYFLHTGHLHIDGLKMSKSLKNFISIQELLKTYNSRQLRILFLLHKYDTLMNYNQNSLSEAVNKEKNYKEFFANMKIEMEKNPLDLNQKWGESEIKLQKKLEEVKEKVHEHLCNNFNTPDVLGEVDQLMNATYIYCKDNKSKLTIVQSIHNYVLFIFKCMGLDFQPAAGGQGGEHLSQVIEAFTHFRSQVRTHGKQKDLAQVLVDCDVIRDDVLPFLGIRIEDIAGQQHSVWKLDDPQNLIKARELAIKQKQQVEEMKRKKQMALLEKEAKMKVDPKQLFIHQTDKYSAFNENGVPTLDKDGKELSKSLAKKLQKEWEKQNENYQKYLKTQEQKQDS